MTIFVVLHRRVPGDGSCFDVKGEQMGIERNHEELIAENAEPTVDKSAACREVRRQFAAIPPDLASAPRVDRPRHVLWSSNVQNVIAKERRGFEIANRAGLERPLRSEAIYIRRCDLR